MRLDAVIVGALGSWDPPNEPTLKALRISPRYCRMNRKFIISDTIRWSRDIYVEHLTGRRQFSVPATTTTDPAQDPINDPTQAAVPTNEPVNNPADEPNYNPIVEQNHIVDELNNPADE